MKPPKKRKAPAKNGTSTAAAPAKADSKRAEPKRAKTSTPAEAQGKRAKAVATSEVVPKRRSSAGKNAAPAEAPTKKNSKKEPAEAPTKKESKKEPVEAASKKDSKKEATDGAQVRKPPLLKIRKRPRSATLPPAEPIAAEPLPTAAPVVQSQPLPPVATAVAELRKVSAPTQPAPPLQELTCLAPVDADAVTAAIQAVGGTIPIPNGLEPQADALDLDDPGPAKKQARGTCSIAVMQCATDSC